MYVQTTQTRTVHMLSAKSNYVANIMHYLPTKNNTFSKLTYQSVKRSKIAKGFKINNEKPFNYN